MRHEGTLWSDSGFSFWYFATLGTPIWDFLPYFNGESHCVLTFSSTSSDPGFLSWYLRTTIFPRGITPLRVHPRYRFLCRLRNRLFLDKQVFVRKAGFVMATHNDSIHELMTKKPTTEAPLQHVATTERRGKRRCKITQLMRIRPSDPKKPHFEDLRGSVSVSRSGVYFQSSEPAYEVGLRLFVTMPYSNDPASLNREYLAEVVRRDTLPTGMFGIGIKILMEMGIQHSYNFGGSTPF